MNELVSVIIPVYNAENFIQKCIESLLNQTYDNFEVIIINDGSTDKSLEKIKQMNLDENIFRIYKQENNGVSSARNHGISKAKGKYLTFIDSDDTYESDYIHTLVERIEKDNSDIAICGFGRIDTKTNNVIAITKVQDEVVSIEDFINRFWSFYDLNILNSNCNKLYKTQLIKEKSIKFNETLKIGEDLNFNLDYFKTAKQVSLSSKCLFNYMQHSNQTMQKGYIDFFEDSLVYSKNIESLLNKFNSYEDRQFFDHYASEINIAVSNIVRSNAEISEKLTKLNKVFDCEYVSKINQSPFQFSGLKGLVKNKRKYILFSLFTMSKIYRRICNINGK